MSLKKNFLYSCILMVSTYVFPLVVYPYVSRTLGLTNIGIVNFVDSLINYFVLISMMGIVTVGVREIACVRNDATRLSKTFNSLLMLTLVSTVIAIVILLIAMYTVPKLFPFRYLLYVGVIKLAFNAFLLEWFFTGMEDFKYITNRSLFVKCLFVASIFIFVRKASDYKLYYILSVSAVVVNALINIIYSRRFIKYSFRGIEAKPFVRSFLIMGGYVLVTNIYTSLNPVWLGFVTNTNEVGYFTTATKLHTIVMAVLTSFTGVLFPRMSHLLAVGKDKEFWGKISLALDAIYFFAFPTIVFLIIGGPDALHIIVGDGFEGAYLPLQIISPLVLIIGIEQILVIQILMAKHQDNIVLRNSIIGAVACIIFNIILTKQLGSTGSAIVWIISEMVVLTAALIDVRQKFGYAFPFKRLSSHILFFCILTAIAWPVYNMIENVWVALGCLGIFIVIYTALVEIVLLKNNAVLQLIPRQISDKWKRTKKSGTTE